MHIIYRCPREPWAALGKTRVSNKCFEKCPFFGTFTILKVLKEIVWNNKNLATFVAGFFFVPNNRGSRGCRSAQHERLHAKKGPPDLFLNAWTVHKESVKNSFNPQNFIVSEGFFFVCESRITVLLL